MRNKIRTILKIIFSLLLILFSFHKAGILDPQGREKFFSIVKNANLFLILISFALTIVINLSSSIKWKMLLSPRGLNVSLIRLYAYYNIGKFFNLILPTSMGGDIFRVLKGLRQRGPALSSGCFFCLENAFLVAR